MMEMRQRSAPESIAVAALRLMRDGCFPARLEEETASGNAFDRAAVAHSENRREPLI